MVLNTDKLKHLFQRTFDIRAGEMRRAILMNLNIFLLITTLLIIKPTINSLFLTNVGIEKLPLAFILVAIGAGIISSFYTKMLRTTPLSKIIKTTLVISVCTIMVFAIMLRLNYIEAWILYLFYVWVAVFGVLTASQFWIFANIVFNAREAKRLFGFIGSGAIVGGIFGGYLASFMATFIGSENLLFVAAFFLVLCFPVNRAIWKSKGMNTLTLSRQKKKINTITEHPVRLIKNSRHLTYLALITVLSVLVARLIDYQFSAISSSKIPDEDELTAFFGFWFSNFNILSLIIQLFLTRRVVGVFGVGFSLFFLPAGIFIGALAVFFVPGLWSAIFIKSCDGSLKQSINKSAIELLALPIPTEIKNQAKTFIDVVVDSIATGLSGIILVTFVNGLEISAKYVSLIVILLLLLWFYIATKVRKEYILLFKYKLRKYDSGKKDIPGLSGESVYGGLKKVLESGSVKQILFILKKTEDINHDHLFESLKKLLKHDSPEVRAEALRKLLHYKTESLLDEVNPLVNDNDYNVKVAAIEYLIEHSPKQRDDLIKRYLYDKDYRISGATLLSLIHEIKDNPQLKDFYKLEDLIDQRINKLKDTHNHDELKFRKINLTRMIGQANLPSYYSYLNGFFNDPDPEVVKQAIISAGNTLELEYIPEIIKFLKVRSLRDSAVVSLANYSNIIIDYFEYVIKQHDPDLEIIRLIPRVIVEIHTQASVNFMFHLLDYGDSEVRSESLESLIKLKVDYPYLIFSKKQIISIIFNEAKLYLNTLSALYTQQLGIRQNEKTSIEDSDDKSYEARVYLISLLEIRLDENLERIFKLLELKYPPDEIDTVYRNIKSEKPDLRVNAIEFLDNLLELNLKRILIPIIEAATLESITSDTLISLNIRLTDQYECFGLLLRGRDAQLKIAVFKLISKLNETAYLDLVEPYKNDENALLKAVAQSTIKSLKS